MARYRGRVVVRKVDWKGNQIKGSLKAWIKKNPGKKYYDSKIEYEAAVFFKKQKIKVKEKPELILFDSIETQEFKKGEIKDVKQRDIKFSPDYYLPNIDVYIEIKGYADPLFKMRWKLFKLKGYKGFVIYTLNELKELIKQLENDDMK